MTYLFQNVEFDVEAFALSRDGARLGLEPKAMQLLLFLIEHRGKLLGKSVIVAAVWEGTFVEESNLTRAIALIRKQLGETRAIPGSSRQFRLAAIASSLRSRS